MSILVKDGNTVDKYFQTIGGGTVSDPFISIPADFKLEIVKGNVPGHSTVNKFGHNSAGAAGLDMWDAGVAYNYYPTTAQACTIVSTSSTDGNTLAGAWTVTVYGLDSNWAEISETVTMNGTTPVALTNNYIRLYRAVVMTAGSNETNTGVITVTGGGNIGIHIAIGEGQTQQAIYTVPAGKTAYFTKGYVALSDDDKTGESMEFFWKVRPGIPNGAWQVKGDVALGTLSSSWWVYEYGTPAGPIAEKSDIKISIPDSSSILGCVGGFDLILVDD